MSLPPRSVDRTVLDILAFAPLAVIAFYRLAGPMVRHFGVTCQPSAAFSPPDSAGPGRRSREGHWNEQAKALITGLILHIVTQPPPKRRVG